MHLRRIWVLLAATLTATTAAAASLDLGSRGITHFLLCDRNGDGIAKALDRDLDGDGRPNRRDKDVDGDGTPNGQDADVDGDCVLNGEDRDVDGDGRRNGADNDTDGDGTPDFLDSDVDGDGTPNHADDDSDGTGDYWITKAPDEVNRRVPPEFFGLVADDGFWGADDHRAGLSEASAAGIGTIRQVFDWALVEQTRGQLDWTLYDRYVADATRAGVAILPILFNPPAFESSRPHASSAHGTFPPKRNARFARFAKAAVERYGPDGDFWTETPELDPAPLRAWQIWNEPNLGVYWRPKPDPKAYTRMLRRVGGAIRRADEGAEIVAAGVPESRLGMRSVKFVRRMYRAGAHGTFDTFAAHPYAGGVDAVYSNLARVRKILDSHGDRRRELWVTEIGWATGGPEHPYNVGEEGQAQLIERTLATLVAHSKRLRLRGVVYYNWRDLPQIPPANDRWGLHSGLLYGDGTPKPAYGALTDTVGVLARR